MFDTLFYLLAQADGGGSPNFFLTQVVPILFIIAVFYFLLLRPQIKQQREHQSLVTNLKKGDRVITTGGVWGEIDAVETHTVKLKINDKTKITVSRSAIQGPQPKPGDKPPAPGK